MKILGVDVVGLKYSVGQNNSGVYTGVMVIDLSDLALVTFNPTGYDGAYRWWPGLVELHRTGFPEFNQASMSYIKSQIAAHILALRESGLEPEEYSRELTWSGTGLGMGDELLELYHKHLDSLTTEGELLGGDDDE